MAASEISRLTRKRKSVIPVDNVEKEEKSLVRSIGLCLKKPCEQWTDSENELVKAHPDIVSRVQRRMEKNCSRRERELEREESVVVVADKCRRLAEAVRSSRHLVVYTGAGVSTAASIPDYRGPDGIWTRLSRGQQVGEHDLTAATPTYTHMALVSMWRRRLLRHLVSQNCDGLHLRSGLPRRVMSEVHGNMYIEVCTSCPRQYVRNFDVTINTSRSNHKTGRRCYECGTPLIDTVVHFGERGKLRWPLNWSTAVKRARQADIILCLGSSLKVLRKYSWLWCMHRPPEHRPPVYIVNLQWTPKDHCAALKIHARCDDVMRQLMYHLELTVSDYRHCDDPLLRLATPLHRSEPAPASRLVDCGGGGADENQYDRHDDPVKTQPMPPECGVNGASETNVAHMPSAPSTRDAGSVVDTGVLGEVKPEEAVDHEQYFMESSCPGEATSKDSDNSSVSIVKCGADSVSACDYERSSPSDANLCKRVKLELPDEPAVEPMPADGKCFNGCAQSILASELEATEISTCNQLTTAFTSRSQANGNNSNNNNTSNIGDTKLTCANNGDVVHNHEAGCCLLANGPGSSRAASNLFRDNSHTNGNESVAAPTECVGAGDASSENIQREPSASGASGDIAVDTPSHTGRVEGPRGADDLDTDGGPGSTDILLPDHTYNCTLQQPPGWQATRATVERKCVSGAATDGVAQVAAQLRHVAVQTDPIDWHHVKFSVFETLDVDGDDCKCNPIDHVIFEHGERCDTRATAVGDQSTSRTSTTSAATSSQLCHTSSNTSSTCVLSCGAVTSAPARVTSSSSHLCCIDQLRPSDVIFVDDMTSSPDPTTHTRLGRSTFSHVAANMDRPRSCCKYDDCQNDVDNDDGAGDDGVICESAPSELWNDALFSDDVTRADHAPSPQPAADWSARVRCYGSGRASRTCAGSVSYCEPLTSPDISGDSSSESTCESSLSLSGDDDDEDSRSSWSSSSSTASDYQRYHAVFRVSQRLMRPVLRACLPVSSSPTVAASSNGDSATSTAPGWYGKGCKMRRARRRRWC